MTKFYSKILKCFLFTCKIVKFIILGPFKLFGIIFGKKIEFIVNFWQKPNCFIFYLLVLVNHYMGKIYTDSEFSVHIGRWLNPMTLSYINLFRLIFKIIIMHKEWCPVSKSALEIDYFNFTFKSFPILKEKFLCFYF